MVSQLDAAEKVRGSVIEKKVSRISEKGSPTAIKFTNPAVPSLCYARAYAGSMSSSFDE